MKNGLLLILIILTNHLAARNEPNSTNLSNGVQKNGEYTLVINGFDWGAAVTQVILSTNQSTPAINPEDYWVNVERISECFDGKGRGVSGERKVINAYISNDKGKKVEQGNFLTLVLEVNPDLPISSPLEYFFDEKCQGTKWVDYHMTIVNKKNNDTWNTEIGRISPIADDFDLNGKFTYDQTKTLAYASLTPKSEGKCPLIIWLHGGGEGGTDPSIPLLSNKVTNYASFEIQTIFNGAFVLVPQCPTAWMDNGNGGITRGEENDIYNEGLMNLIQHFVTNNPKVDKDRIYVGGCSNGGYMSLKLILLHPDYFAAGYISALAYSSKYISDKDIQRIKDVPIWFMHSRDDKVTIPEKTVVPIYQRLMGAGATDVHFSYFDHVVDLTGLFGGPDYHYNGHFSWIYSHANKCMLDYDGSYVTVGGRPVSIMEWMARQSK